MSASRTSPSSQTLRPQSAWTSSQMPISAELELESAPAVYPLLYNQSEAALIPLTVTGKTDMQMSKSSAEREVERLQKEVNALKLKEVERQQTEFGEQR